MKYRREWGWFDLVYMAWWVLTVKVCPGGNKCKIKIKNNISYWIFQYLKVSTSCLSIYMPCLKDWFGHEIDKEVVCTGLCKLNGVRFGEMSLFLSFVYFWFQYLYVIICLDISFVPRLNFSWAKNNVTSTSKHINGGWDEKYNLPLLTSPLLFCNYSNNVWSQNTWNGSNAVANSH